MTKFRPFPVPHEAPRSVSVAFGGRTYTGSTSAWGGTDTAEYNLMGGRMNILDIPAPGSVPQIDGKYALDLSAVNAAETRTFLADGNQQVTLNIAAPKQIGKWGDGIHYQLERDPATEDLIIEPGRNHRKVYVTAGAHGYTKAKIAAEVGGGMTEAQVTNAWLKAQTTYGGSPAKALEPVTGLLFWNSITANRGATVNKRQSNWLMLESGYTYDVGPQGSTHFIPEAVDGESLLHPMVITRYGTGKAPVAAGRGLQAFSGSKKVAVIGISNGVKTSHITGDYFLYADMTNEPGATEFSMDVGMSFRTIYRCMIADVHLPAPRNGATWSAHYDRTSGIYANYVNHFLVEDTFLDHNGWKDGYDPVVLDYALNPNQPPSIYSHNAYLNYNNRDLTFIGNLSSRAASMGSQVRSGGRICENLYLDNQQAGNEIAGGTADYAGNYTLLSRNVITSASYLPFPPPDGAFNLGYEIQGRDPVSLDNIVCHMANPNDPAEKAAKPKANKTIWANGTTFAFDNQINYKWDSVDRNVEGLNTTTLNATTIQNFAATKLPGGTAPTIKNFLNWMKTLTPRQRQVLQREAMAYFRAPYDAKLEMSAVKRTTATTCTFRPEPRGEGILWDNPINWTTDDLPGTVSGDSVNLHGNFVRFGRLTASVPVSFSGGILDVVSGKLTATQQTGVADVRVRNCGQYFAPANAHGDYIVTDDARLVFGGAATVDLEVAGLAECILGPNLTLERLAIRGGDCWVGWDGTGTATASGPLKFIADGGKIGKLRRFKRRGDDPDPTVNATYALTSLTINATGLAPGTYDLGGGAGTGVTYANPNAIALPAGVTLTGGNLTLVVS